MKKYTAIIAALLLLTTGCHKSPSADKLSTPGATKRFGMITGLKPDKLAYYKQLHADAWPAVLKKISECNIHNYSIYLKEIEGKYFLFSYFEYTGTDFDADMKKMANDSTTQRWWKETDPCQQPLPDAASQGQIWSSMEEVFHTP
ncbi:MAG TPA: L-rhamnose mutarotase [Agriterribacter sp.]|nr:L-rhamnose mutarotase [Agriterribacter sp.]